MLLTGCIIWPNSLSPVNLADIPLEQQAVPNVLGPKELPEMSELPGTDCVFGGVVQVKIHSVLSVPSFQIITLLQQDHRFFL